ncbi:MAG: protein O-mannosyl-transferase family, partial [Candidatus Syntrophosphaera sp.]
MSKKSKQEVRQIKQKIRKTGSAEKARPEYKVPEKPAPVEVAELRPQPLVPKKLNTLVAWIIFVVALAVYLLTQARSLSFWDSGEYATCISILGVPHPPGNPFYILFGRALVSLFGGFIPHAQIAAFISVLTSAFAVMFTYLITVQLTSMFRIKYWEAIFGGVIAAL